MCTLFQHSKTERVPILSRHKKQNKATVDFCGILFWTPSIIMMFLRDNVVKSTKKIVSLYKLVMTLCHLFDFVQ